MLLILSFVHALSSYWTYLSRTVPGVSDLFQPLEMPSTKLISSLTECPPCSKLTRDLLALPVRLGGLGLVNPTETSNKLQVYMKLKAPPLSHKIKPVKSILMISLSRRIRAQSGSSLLPLTEQGFCLHKGEFRVPYVCVMGGPSLTLPSSVTVAKPSPLIIPGADPEIEEEGGIHVKWGLVRRA